MTRPTLTTPPIMPRHVASARLRDPAPGEAARLAHAVIEDAITTATRLGRAVVVDVWVREACAEDSARGTL